MGLFSKFKEKVADVEQKQALIYKIANNPEYNYTLNSNITNGISKEYECIFHNVHKRSTEVQKNIYTYIFKNNDSLIYYEGNDELYCVDEKKLSRDSAIWVGDIVELQLDKEQCSFYITKKIKNTNKIFEATGVDNMDLSKFEGLM